MNAQIEQGGEGLRENVDAFVAAVRQLCAPSGEVPSYQDLACLLAQLHRSVRCSPEVRWDDADDFDLDAARRSAGVPAVYERLREAFGAVNAYPTIRRDEEASIAFGSLADDIADIYGDLMVGIQALDAGIGMNNVVWAWRFSFDSHWGSHLLDASRALHHLLTGT